MKIARIETYSLRTKLPQPFAYSQYWFQTRGTMIVRVVTDDGLDGIGEAFGPAELTSAVIENVYGPLLMGRDPLDNEVLWEELYALLRDHGQKGIPIEALSAVDIALWDIKGKAAKLPVCKLLGGEFRSRIQPYATGFYRVGHLTDQQDALCREAVELIAAGFRAMKTKIGFGLEDDERTIRAVRRAVGGEIRLMTDANHAYDAAAAIRIGRVLEENGYEWFEEPVPPEDLDGYQRVHDALDIPIAAGEAEFTRFGMKALLCRRLVDIVQPDCCAVGGLTEAKRVSVLANTFGVRCVPHVWGTRIGMAAALHLAASLPPTPPSLVPIEPLLEFDCSSFPLREAVVNERISLDCDGLVAVPRTPGLGVTLNLDFVAKNAVKAFVLPGKRGARS